MILGFSSNNEAKMSQLLDLLSFVNETFGLEEIANFSLFIIHYTLIFLALTLLSFLKDYVIHFHMFVFHELLSKHMTFLQVFT